MIFKKESADNKKSWKIFQSLFSIKTGEYLNEPSKWKGFDNKVPKLSRVQIFYKEIRRIIQKNDLWPPLQSTWVKVQNFQNPEL